MTVGELCSLVVHPVVTHIGFADIVPGLSIQALHIDRLRVDVQHVRRFVLDRVIAADTVHRAPHEQ